MRGTRTGGPGPWRPRWLWRGEKKEKGADTQEEEPFLNMDSNREKDCWNSDSNNHGKYQCPKLLEKKQTELAQPGGPRLLNKASPNNAVYAAEDK